MSNVIFNDSADYLRYDRENEFAYKDIWYYVPQKCAFAYFLVTYKLKLNGGDIKAVQGDSGHSQINMVTDVYSHIIDDDRRRNAEMFEDAFYGKKDLDPQLRKNEEGENIMTVPEGVDPELLAKVLANPEMAALLSSIAKNMK